MSDLTDWQSDGEFHAKHMLTQRAIGLPRASEYAGAMLTTTLSNALRNFFALHDKVVDDKETVIVTEGARRVAWVDANELERLRSRKLTRVCIALEKSERRAPTAEEILREVS